jgi:murein DD-endopeptidase MepM/ murein hydrolase activator NlpD
MSRVLVALLALFATGWQITFTAPALAQTVIVDIQPRSAKFVLGAPVVHYLRVAPQNSNATPQARMCLRLALTKSGTNNVQLTKVTVALGTNQFQIPVNPALPIPPGTTPTLWTNQTTDCPLFALPAPSTGTLMLTFAGPSTQKTTFVLKAHDGPDYAFPFKTSDRPRGEFWQANSIVHSPGAEGSQLFAYDMTAVGFDKNSQTWTQLKTDNGQLLGGKANTDYRAWGTPIYAMADGKVVHCRKDVPLNPQPFGCCIAGQSCTNVTGYPGSGNSFYIRHSPDEVVEYAHMQPADATCSNFNCKQCVNDGTGQVKKGDLLGHVGNSGNVCGAPHLHIHSMNGTTDTNGYEVPPRFLRPLPFTGASMLVLDPNDDMGPSAPWFKAKKEGPPPAWSAICYGAGPPPANIANIPGKINKLDDAILLSLKQEKLFEEGKRKNPPDIDVEQLTSQVPPLLKQLTAFNSTRCPIDWLCPKLCKWDTGGACTWSGSSSRC